MENWPVAAGRGSRRRLRSGLSALPASAVDGIVPLFFAAVVLGIFNAILRPLALLITFPINLLTLGLFTVVINGATLKLTGDVVCGFTVHGFWSAVLGARLLSVISFAINLLISDTGHVEYRYVERIDRL
ncbi:MAG TPA: phage holin family protein [Candidatus Margulisiibacteriota bacterium]|nr:phage holin family protein [Candidatus Margulisiibacteriota bacterium]